jgi:hypothetical protein
MIDTKTPTIALTAEVAAPISDLKKVKKNKSLKGAIIEAGIILASIYVVGFIAELVYKFIICPSC